MRYSLLRLILKKFSSLYFHYHLITKKMKVFFNFHSIPFSIQIIPLLLLILSCSTEVEENQANSDGGLSIKKLVVALKANKNPQMMLEQKNHLEEYLSNKLTSTVEVIIPSDSSIVVESFRNGTLDVGYLSSTDAARNLEQKTASVFLVHLKNGKTFYESVWLSLKEKSFESIADLKQKPIAFASRSSTSGYLIPVWDLVEKGLVKGDGSLKDFFSEVIYGSGYVSAVEKVLSGEVEAAAVSDYVYKGDYSYLKPSQKSKLKIVQSQGPVPAHTLCIRSSISDEDKKILLNAFLGMNEDNPELRDELFNGKLITVDQDEHLEILKKAFYAEQNLKSTSGNPPS